MPVLSQYHMEDNHEKIFYLYEMKFKEDINLYIYQLDTRINLNNNKRVNKALLVHKPSIKSFHLFHVSIFKCCHII